MLFSKFKQHKQEGEFSNLIVQLVQTLQLQCSKRRNDSKLHSGCMDSVTLLSEKLQLETDLTLDKAVTLACKREFITK